MRHLDHLVYAVPHLEEYVEFFEQHTGVRAVYGGQHPRAGTENYLVRLEDGTDNPCYLELIGLDPKQPDVAGEDTMFRIGALGDDFPPRLVTWAIHLPEIDLLPEEVSVGEYKFNFPRPTAASRTTPDGRLLRWRFAVGNPLPLAGLQPFLIDWGETAHPCENLLGQPALALKSIKAEYEHPEVLAALYGFLGLDVPITASPSPALCVELTTPKGSFQLR
ncbi:MAG: VOC family protein [Propionibacteriaceae bacterium]|jgi:hypothetical protein|nr:VOC family protein [Propionibacteriaceae bacterium]